MLIRYGELKLQWMFCLQMCVYAISTNLVFSVILMVILMVIIGITHVVSSSKVLIPLRLLRLLLELSDHQQVILLFDDFASICQ